MKRLAVILPLTLLALSGCSETQAPSAQVTPALVSAPAELVSLETATIGPPNVRRMWQYKIEMMAPENTQVKKGEVILKFDGQRLKTNLIGHNSELQAEIKKAESQKLNDAAKEQELVLALAEAEMNFDKARRKAEIVDASRSKVEREKLKMDHIYYTENLVQAKQRLEHHRKAMVINQQVAQGRVNTLQSKVDSIKKDLQKLNVKAPKDGLVTYIQDWNGEKPAVGETVYMGRSLLELPSLDKIALKAEFSEPDTAKLQQGQTVKVLFEAYPEMAYQGHIAKLGQAYYPKSSNNPKVIFDALIELNDGRPDVMRPGMKAKIEVLPQ